MNQGYGFYFEQAGRSRPQGAVASEEEYFEGSAAEESVARELGQNSLDAVDPKGDGPVRMVFELCEMDTAVIPDIENLRSHLDSVAEATKETKGFERMQRAAASAKSKSVMVLRVGDYGTKGLLGQEGIDDTTSPLVALTRGAGISANDGPRGGSFGIGSAVGSMSSDLCTVLWTSLATDKDEVVFSGYCRLATHKDSDGVFRQADGFYTQLTNQDNFEYLRNPAAIGPFDHRTEHGTDVYILGYRKAADDPALIHIRDAFVSNFFVAIHRGALVVEGRTPQGEWVLDATTLAELVRSMPDVLPFYRALQDPEPYLAEVPGLGELRLFVEVDDALPRKMYTTTVRGPLMRIAQYKHHSVSAKYAAILDCSNEEANAALRVLEPPLHNDWDPARAEDGGTLVSKLKRFIGDGLKAKVRAQVGEEVKIDSLHRLLPSTLGPETKEQDSTMGNATLGEGTDVESGTVQGKPSDELAISNPTGRSVPIRVMKPATNDGSEQTERGKDRGGAGKREGGGVGLPSSGSEGEGRARIHAGDIQMRSWTEPATGELIVVIHASAPTAGDLTLAPLGAGGQVEAGYTLPIRRVVLETKSGPQPLEYVGNTIQGLDLNAEAPSTRLRIELDEPHRYRMGVI